MANWGNVAGGAASGAATGSVLGPWGALAGGAIGALPGLFSGKKGNKLLGGSNAIRENVSTLRPEQEPLFQQLQNAAMNRGAGGSFGDSADYYRNLLSDNSEDYKAFSRPQIRQFNEEIIPGLSEQFAGMGSGGLSSSGFRNAAVNAGTDLSERLGAIRASLRHSGAQGLTNIGQLGLGNYSQNMETQGASNGFLSDFAPTAGNLFAQSAGDWFKSKPEPQAAPGVNSFGGSTVGGRTSPYGSPPSSSNGFNLPNFSTRRGA